jgi:YYY domain-containing protein
MVLRLIFWYLVLVSLGWLTFPLAYRLFSKLSDRGYTFSRVLGLLLWGFFFWLFGSLGVLRNQPGGVLFALSLLVGASLWVSWPRRFEIFGWIKTNWRLILMAEGVFLVFFAFMAIVRASDPAATGTEKPMELAFINAVIKSEGFPPHDPWLSGYAISYYHFGYILTGMLAKLTFTSGAVAFNLMLASVFSMSAVGAYGVLFNLLEAHAGEIKTALNHLFWAVLGPIFLLFVSNLEAVLEVLHQAGVGWGLETGTSRFWEWVNIDSLRTPPVGSSSLIPQRFWWWWQASRVIQDIDLLGNVSPLSPIDEFPAFSFVLGDLHPHVLVMPFVMLMIGLAFNVYRGGLDGEWRISGFSLPYRPGPFFISAILLGGIAFLNTWDLPVYFTLLLGAFVLRRVYQQGWGWDRLSDLLKLAVPLGLISLLLYTPFFISFQSQAGGILPNLIYPTRGLYLWVMFGTLLIPIFLLFLNLFLKKKPGNWKWGAGLVLALLAALILLALVLGFVIAQTQIGQQVLESQGQRSFWEALPTITSHRVRFGAGLFTLILLLVMGCSFLIGMARKHGDKIEAEDRTLPFVLLMVVLGGVMVLAPEFVYLRDVFGARMNTVFKFYYQAWMLWSASAAFASVLILKSGKLFGKTLVVLTLILGLVYPVLAFPTKTNGFSPQSGFTLDASAYLARSNPDEFAAINWLSDAPFGVVAEAVGGQYSGFARVSTLSGQAAVLGWPGHQGQWRGGYEEVGSREPDMRTLFETPDWLVALDIIQRYRIRYIFIGSLEANTYALNLEKFEMNLQAGFVQGGVRVFLVPQTLTD